ncbi:hypothetical protein CVV26_02730 [Candidatus Kuenenbacteria bacterium HGW-Kuenenbacteria-1]|uniref:Bacterial Ig-like domain-containing protein n=1 Tax=Candidatus Kuenenbacteria bacterium HGW-Kuenenbacteria-1 TaxID=2013812 RepID=A0A2N1UMZ4_9BACT|nr:MAG: hypothetical protein CVV26_02730 [Candidatus Kuenenbacteria bacterium HGW-Kuenenbacteria-1]
MKKDFKKSLVLIFLLTGFLMSANFAFASSTDGTINSSNKYAWAENIGWINFGTINGNVHITDVSLSGYALSENIGWINLSNIANDGEGHLSGYAWSENTGWINFAPINGGVIINSAGEFIGSALSENIGWIIFGGDYKVKTDWRPRSARPACNNAIDDDEDNKIDYPNDPGCDSLNDTSEIDSSGSSLPITVYNAPIQPESGNFNISIQNDAEYINSRTVILKLNGGADAKKMAISNTGDFLDANQENYQAQKEWDLCSKNSGFIKLPDCLDGVHTVYIKFYTQYGQPSTVVSDQIILDTKSPEIKIIDKKDYYDIAQDIILNIETETKAEIISHWDKKYGSVYANSQGKAIINLNKMLAGKHQLEITATDLAGNKSKTLAIELIIKPLIEILKIEPDVILKEPQQPIIEKIKPLISESLKLIKEEKSEVIPVVPKELQKPITEKAKLLIPEFLKPQEEKPNEMIIIPEEAPLLIQKQWKLFSEESVKSFVLAPLPKEIIELSEKFPELKKTLNDVGILKITDLEKLKTVELTLPGLTERLGLSTYKIESEKFDLPMGIPVSQLSLENKKLIPSEIIFAKTSKELIDFNISLSVTEKGELQQKITTISGKPLQLVIKQDKPVKSIKGYLILKSRKIQKTSSFFFLESAINKIKNYFPINFIFTNPVLAESQKESAISEERFALSKFDYTDLDNDGIYTAEIQMPLVDGKYEIVTVMNYKDPTLGKKEIKLITVVDPEGYIYAKDNEKEIRIPDAIVSMYLFNFETKKYVLWPSQKYLQENPQTTDFKGTYSFLVPTGFYYINVKAPDYLVYNTKPFRIKEGSGIHINIELKTKYWWLKIIDWKIILLIVIILFLLYNFIRNKIKRKF